MAVETFPQKKVRPKRLSGRFYQKKQGKNGRWDDSTKKSKAKPSLELSHFWD